MSYRITNDQSISQNFTTLKSLKGDPLHIFILSLVCLNRNCPSLETYSIKTKN